MIRALSLAFAQLTDPRISRLVWISIAGALLLSILLVVAASWMVAALQLTGIGWLDIAIDLLGGAASLFVAWLLYPSVVALLVGFLLEDVARAVELRHYTSLAAPPSHPMIDDVARGIRLALLTIIINIIAIPIYLFIPVISIFVFYTLNGYLFGREYFEQVAFRRADATVVRHLKHRYRGRLWVAGLWISLISTIPIINLIAPVIATAFMTHLFEDLHRRSRMA